MELAEIREVHVSILQKARMAYKPQVPDLLLNIEDTVFEKVERSPPSEDLRSVFPKTWGHSAYRLKKGKGQHKKMRLGVLFSGGPAAGGHNVIAGLCDTGAEVIGFLGGPSGLIENRSIKIANIDSYRNQGGFDLLGTGRTKIETEEQMAAALKSCAPLDGLVIIGGDDSNTNAAHLAEYFIQKGSPVRVVGVPKTIDGDLRSADIEISFGFDSATKTYSELIGNIARDAQSTRKYYHFIKLMGRSASHIVLECALQTRPNLALIGEERLPFKTIVAKIADLIEKRAQNGKNYGVILIPEGLIEFVPEIGELTGEAVEKDPHGNIEVSKIQTEKLLLQAVQKELKKRGFQGKWGGQEHFFGYEGRCCLPSNFDANYSYALGKLAAIAIRENLTGVICSIQNLAQAPKYWEMKMVPIIELMHLEMRLGQKKPVIQKALVDLKGPAFIQFSSLKKEWELSDAYQQPGPIQFFGEKRWTDTVPLSLK